MAKRTEEEKILFNPYCSLSTIQRFFGMDKITAEDIFVKVQEADISDGYMQIYNDRVRSEAVFKILGLDFELALKKYTTKKGGNIVHEGSKTKI